VSAWAVGTAASDRASGRVRAATRACHRVDAVEAKVVLLARLALGATNLSAEAHGPAKSYTL